MLRNKTNKDLYPGCSLIFESSYYIDEGKVIKAKGYDVKTVTLSDLQKDGIIQPENRVVIKEGTELYCYFPNSMKDNIEHILDTISVPKGFSYTLHTCDTL